MAAVSARRKRHTSMLLGGILPIDRARIPVDVIAGRDAGRPGDPRGHGLHEDRRDAGDHRPVHADPAGRCCSRCSGRRATSSSAPTRRRRRSSPSACWRPAPCRAHPSTAQLASLAALMCAVFLILARLLKLGFIANFLSRSVLIGFLTGVGIQVAMGQFGGMFGVTEAERDHAREVLADAAGDPDPDQRARPRRVAGRAGHDPRARAGQQEDPRRAHRGRRRRSSLSYVARPRREGRHRPRHGAQRPPAARPARPPSSPPTTSRALLPTVISMFIVILAQSAATSRAYAMQVRRQLRRERGPHRPRPGQPRRRASAARSWSTAARPRPRWSTAPAAGARSRS